jgi:RNA-directed DNA polymerase
LTRSVATARSRGAPCDAAAHWNAINWNQCNRNVRKLQSRIVKAVQGKRWRDVRSLQRLLVRSHSAKALAVKRVTSNRGKKTPGVDKQIWSTPGAKAKAMTTLGKTGYRPLPLRRVYIPKSNGKRRPLGIPTMFDRAMQALHLMTLDPVAETLLDPYVYGFRRGRSTADAIARCFNIFCRKGSATWIFEGDITGCFDHIGHAWLMKHIPMNKGILHKWLKAGFMDNQTYYPTEEGTPQGGIISPTLMNLTLNGLGAMLRRSLPDKHLGVKEQVYEIVYADDFVISGRSKECLEQRVRPRVQNFLKVRGLTLSREKTKVTHINQGADFLGQNIRKYSGTLLITPAKKSQQALKAKVKRMFRIHRTSSQETLIHCLNPILRGWANYHRHVVSKRVFGSLDHWLWQKLWRWACRRHPAKGKRWIKRRYFHHVDARHWVFQSKKYVRDGTHRRAIYTRLFSMPAIPIRRHVRIRKGANPYDPEWRSYFARRRERKTGKTVAFTHNGRGPG